MNCSQPYIFLRKGHVYGVACLEGFEEAFKMRDTYFPTCCVSVLVNSENYK